MKSFAVIALIAAAANSQQMLGAEEERGRANFLHGSLPHDSHDAAFSHQNAFSNQQQMPQAKAPYYKPQY